MPEQLDLLTYSKFSADCCPSTYTSSIGCLCNNHDEKKREIVLYDLNKDDFMTGKEEEIEEEEQIEEEDEEVYKPFFYRNKLVESINDDGSITYSKLQLEVISHSQS